MNVLVNGSERSLPEGATVADVLRLLGSEPEARGVAVAVHGEVVPRGDWERTPLVAGARVEVVAAIGGG